MIQEALDRGELKVATIYDRLGLRVVPDPAIKATS